VFYTHKYIYNNARRLRLEKLLHAGLSRSSSGFFKSLLDPGGCFLHLKLPHGGFRIETAVAQPLQEVKR
jgi:hypothetical protein